MPDPIIDATPFARVGESMREVGLVHTRLMRQIGEAARRYAIDIAKAYDVPLWVAGLAKAPRRFDRLRYRCPECRRGCRGPWQLAKHERTAHR